MTAWLTSWVVAFQSRIDIAPIERHFADKLLIKQ